MPYAGKVLDQSLPEGRAECTVEVRDGVVLATLDEGRTFTVPLATLVLTRQGFDGDILSFCAEGTEQPRIQTRDAKILKDLKQDAGGKSAVARSAAARRKDWARKAVLPLATLAVLVAGGAWFVLGPLVDLALVAIPISADRQLGEIAFPSTLQQLGPEVTEPAVVEPLKAMVAELAATLPSEPKFEFRTHVVKTDLVNAFALPGGIVVVTTGLLKKASSPEAVSGVLAHELSHVTGRHSMRGLLKKIGLWALLAIVLGDVSNLSALLFQQGAALAELGFSREMEAEADREGVAVLVKAQLDPTGLRQFLQSLQQEEADGPLADQKWVKFVSSHPITSERIAALDALVAETPVASPRPPSVDWKKLVAAVP